MIRGGTEPREPARSGAEQDTTTAWRRLYCYLGRPGVASGIKRQIRRRERRRWQLVTCDLCGGSPVVGSDAGQALCATCMQKTGA